MNKLFYAVVLSTIIAAGSALAQEQRKYEMPPSSSTYGDVPVISDEAMKDCVILHNEMKWLNEKFETTKVNRYSQASVDAYNRKLSRLKSMQKNFNSDCAGKQSHSAWKATQDLNKKGPQ